ncbi:putative RNA-dependend RNA polymerase [Okra mosaic virus]|uniref:Non-structural replication polyprotein n=1 Tax=Okra mosaic virus TaxID=70822 RepID=A5JPL3_9VIRU|nr:putative RNA-dependend RNA polymerase [Okra mosaic virus]ABQ45359.1 putative RNA-dependend RNA polymerase [Okra mosaic virus]
MAFQLALDALSNTSHRDPSLHPVLESVTDSIRHSLTNYPWAVPKANLSFLLSSGIPVSNLGSSQHPHPTHKILETHLLFNHWTHLAVQPASVLFMKPQKFHKLQRLNPNFQHLHNYHITPKDFTRFPSSSTTLPNTPVVFMHDALMYYHPSQIVHLFLQSPQLVHLYASLVVPPESSFTDLSLYPDIYNYQIHSQTLHYVPEGHSAGAYNQPLQSLSWLKTSSISHPEVHLTISILDSWGPLHSLLITRFTPPKNPSHPPPPTHPNHFNSVTSDQKDVASFRIPRMLQLPNPTYLNQPLRDRLVPESVYNALFTYTRAVRTLRVSDPAGFVRTHSNKPEHSWVTPSAWDNLHTFALLNCHHRPNTVFHFFQTPLSNLKLYLQQHWRRITAVAAPTLSFLILLPRFLQWSLPLAKVKSISAFRRQIYLSPPPAVPPPPPPSPFPLPPLLSFLGPLLQPFLADNHPLVPAFRQLLFRSFPALFSSSPAKKSPPLPVLPRVTFTPCRLPLNTPVPLALLASLVPELFILASKILQPPSPQLRDELYHSHLHPPLFHLQWGRSPLVLQVPTPFLPFEPLPNPPPPPQSMLPAPPPPPPSFPALPPAPPQNSPPSPLPSNQAIADSSPATSPSNTSTPNSPPTFGPNNSPAPKSESSNGSFPSTSTPSPPHPDPETPDQSDLPRSNLYHPSGELNYQASPPVTSPDSPLVPVVPLPQELLPPLIADVTCCGPVLAFSTLFPEEYHASSASFQTRLRLLPPTPLPMPSNNCLLTALSPSLNLSEERLWSALQEILPDSLLSNAEIDQPGMSTDLLVALCYTFKFQCTISSDLGLLHYGLKRSSQTVFIKHTNGPPAHYSELPRLSGASRPTTSPLAEAALRFQFRGHHLPFSTVHSYTTDLARAKNLISNMKNGFDGILSTIDPNVKHSPGQSPRDKILALDRLIDPAVPKTVELIHIAGFAGCGKTLPVQHLLRTRPFSSFRVCCPTTELRNEWKRDLSLPSHLSWKFCTWESSLLKQSPVLVIDEVYKLPRGYVDLAIQADPLLQFVILLGDPLQGEYHSTSPHSSNHTLSPESSHLLRFIDFYCFWSHRVPSPICDLFGLPSFNKSSLTYRHHVRFTEHYNLGQQNLVNSIATANAVSQLGFPTCTISASQGLTFRKHVTVLLDKHSRRLSPSNAIVALTRSTAGVDFLGASDALSGTNNSCDIFSRAIYQQPINLHTAFPNIFPHLNLITSPLQRRSNRLTGSHNPITTPLLSRHSHLPPHIPCDYRRDFLVQNPILPGFGPEERLDVHFLPPTRLPLQSDLLSTLPSSSDPTPPPSDFSTPITPVYPGETFENLAAHFLPAHDPDLKEILWQDQSSNQFPWFDRPFSLSCQPSSLLAAKHSPAKDPTLLPASIKKRLRFRPSESPHQITSNDVILGHILYQSLCRAYNRPPHLTIPFNESLFADCININDYAQLSSKTKATLVANAGRSDPDWRHTAVRIFAKAQHKVNDGSIFGNWKACQTLALMHDFVILTLGPVKKYQRFFDSQDRPPHIYSHLGKTPSQLSSWSHSFLPPGPKLANDYTSFDQSQHGESVVLEVLKMKRLSIPSHLIQLHLHLKTHVSTQFGPLTCMRLTGEPGTYDDNTDYNLAVLFSQYDLSSTHVMVSGDDSLIAGLPTERPEWPSIHRLLHLRFKTETTSQPLFCGYYVGPAGAIRNPLALFAKLMIAFDDDALPERRLSYLTEFSIGHLLGDALWSLLPDHLHPFQSACFDFFSRFCPPHEKMLLSSDPLPIHLLERVTSSARWLSKTATSALPTRLTRKILDFSQSQSSTKTPKSPT